MNNFALCLIRRVSIALVATASVLLNTTLAAELPDGLIADYRAAVEGDANAAKQAFEGFTQLVERSPNEPVALVHLGSVQTLMGRDAWMPWNKMRHTEKGLDTMAKAVEILGSVPSEQTFQHVPVDIAVKTVAGISFVSVPKFFGRHGEGADLLNAMVADERLKNLDYRASAPVYFYAGQVAEDADQNDEAVTLYRALLLVSGEGSYAEQARQRLAALGASQ